MGNACPHPPTQHNPHQVTWHVYYGDVHIGMMGQRAGVPVDVDQWQWSCGFYPGLHPGQHRYGTAATFEEARAGFEADWQRLLPEIPEGAFEEWRHQRDFTKRKYAEWDRGEIPRRVSSSMMRCVCGVNRLRWHLDRVQGVTVAPSPSRSPALTSSMGS
jgi:hypothetical protein